MYNVCTIDADAFRSAFAVSDPFIGRVNGSRRKTQQRLEAHAATAFSLTALHAHVSGLAGAPRCTRSRLTSRVSGRPRHPESQLRTPPRRPSRPPPCPGCRVPDLFGSEPTASPVWRPSSGTAFKSRLFDRARWHWQLQKPSLELLSSQLASGRFRCQAIQLFRLARQLERESWARCKADLCGVRFVEVLDNVQDSLRDVVFVQEGSFCEGPADDRVQRDCRCWDRGDADTPNQSASGGVKGSREGHGDRGDLSAAALLLSARRSSTCSSSEVRVCSRHLCISCAT